MTEYEKIIESVEAITERVNRIITERQLDEIAHHLAEYGYVKVVRCRDCKLWESNDCEWNPFCNDPDFDEPDGFCAWGERKEDA